MGISKDIKMAVLLWVLCNLYFKLATLIFIDQPIDSLSSFPVTNFLYLFLKIPDDGDPSLPQWLPEG